jgi:hypothetical protein
MAVFPFTIRATDSEGSFADRQFSITVRNSRVERFMAVTGADAYTSADGQSWVLRAGMGGSSCAYGNNMWLIGPISIGGLRRSTDGVNYTYIDPASMTFTHLNDPRTGTNAAGNPSMFLGRISKIRFYNGRFWFWQSQTINTSNVGRQSLRVWYSENGIDWFGRTLLHNNNSATNFINNMQSSGEFITEDNGTLFIGSAVGGGSDPILHPDFGTGGTPLGFQSTDNGNTWAPVRRAGLANSLNLNNANITLTRVNGFYLAYGMNNNFGFGTLSNTYAYSTDGSNWTQGDFSVGTGQSATNIANLLNGTRPNGFIYANGLIYVSMAATASSSPGYLPMLVSADGISWTLRTNIIDFSRTTGSGSNTGDWGRGNIIYRNGIFLLAHQGGGSADTLGSGGVSVFSGGLRFSTNGSTWTTVNRFDNTATLFLDAAMI